MAENGQGKAITVFTTITWSMACGFAGLCMWGFCFLNDRYIEVNKIATDNYQSNSSKISDAIQRVARVEESIINTKETLTEIKSSIKDILRAVK